MSLARHLEVQIRALTGFVELLEEEQAALSSSTIDGNVIQQIAVKKQDMLGRLESLESQRAKGQMMLGYPEGMTGAAKAAMDAKCNIIWDQIINMAFRAKQLNEINGSLVKIRLEQTQKLVNFLHNAAGGPLYGPDGKSRTKGLGGVSTLA